MQKYLIDTNVFIEAKNRYYSFKTFPGFWDWLLNCKQQGIVASTKSVRDELLHGNDELSDWVKDECEKSWFLFDGDVTTQKNFSKISEWVMAQDFKDKAKYDFLSGADPLLIAKSKTLNSILVTHERADSKSKRKVLIPNVCKAFGVNYVDTFQMMSNLGVVFKKFDSSRSLSIADTEL